jgi:hypothetical protein
MPCTFLPCLGTSSFQERHTLTQWIHTQDSKDKSGVLARVDEGRKDRRPSGRITISQRKHHAGNPAPKSINRICLPFRPSSALPADMLSHDPKSPLKNKTKRKKNASDITMTPISYPSLRPTPRSLAPQKAIWHTLRLEKKRQRRKSKTPSQMRHAMRARSCISTHALLDTPKIHAKIYPRKYDLLSCRTHRITAFRPTRGLPGSPGSGSPGSARLLR